MYELPTFVKCAFPHTPWHEKAVRRGCVFIPPFPPFAIPTRSVHHHTHPEYCRIHPIIRATVNRTMRTLLHHDHSAAVAPRKVGSSINVSFVIGIPILRRLSTLSFKRPLIPVAQEEFRHELPCHLHLVSGVTCFHHLAHSPLSFGSVVFYDFRHFPLEVGIPVSAPIHVHSLPSVGHIIGRPNSVLYSHATSVSSQQSLQK